MRHIENIKEAAYDLMRKCWRTALPAVLLYAIVAGLVYSGCYMGLKWCVVTLYTAASIGIFQNADVLWIENMLLALTYLIVVFALSGLNVGLSKYMLNIAGSGKPKLSTVFITLKKSGLKPYGVTLLIILKALPCVLIVGIPGYILTRCAEPAGNIAEMLTWLLNVTGNIAILAGLFWGAVVVEKYCMSYFVMADAPELEASETLKRSEKLMRSQPEDRLRLSGRYIGVFIALYMVMTVLILLFGGVMFIPLIAVMGIFVILFVLYAEITNTVLYRALVVAVPEQNQVQ